MFSNINHSRTELNVKTSKSFSTFDECVNACFKYESMRSRLASHPNKNLSSSNSTKQEDLVPIVFGNLLYKEKALNSPHVELTTKINAIIIMVTPL